MPVALKWVYLVTPPLSLHSIMWSWEQEVPFSPEGILHCLIVCGERVGGPRQTVDGEGEKLSGSQCSSSIDSLSWWKEAFPCSCSPLSLSSTQMSRHLTSRWSPSTTLMSSPSSLKVSERSSMRILVCMLCNGFYLFHFIWVTCIFFSLCQCCAQRQTSTLWWTPLEPSSRSVVLTCEFLRHFFSHCTKYISQTHRTV